MKIAVYPGSFDPCTNGHLDIIHKASKMFDRIVVAVLVNNSKQPLFTTEERVALLRTALEGIDNVEVHSFSGLLVDFMEQVGSTIIVKGIRALSDFEYEFQMALTNNALSPEIETVFIPSGKNYMFLSSSLVKEIARYGGSLTGLVPDPLIPIINKRFQGSCNL